MSSTPSASSPSAGSPVFGANLLGLDYRAEARRLGPPVVPIIDVHAHLQGGRSAAVYREVCDLYGVRLTYSQTRLDLAEGVRQTMGERVRFVAIPSWHETDRRRAFTEGFLEVIPVWREKFGARMIKLWAAPRLYDLIDPSEAADIVPLDAPWRVRAAELAQSLGMMIMCHVADPDTWFATKYADQARYRAKRDHHASLERMLERFTNPWIAAHMGGWPEDLSGLDRLLERYPHLHLDVSATKWIVRELSAHPEGRVEAFFQRWEGRLLFGSDIVTQEDHLVAKPPDPKKFAADLANSPEEAFQLYASRYWALRTMFETGYDAPSPIADPDLAMVDPGRYTPMSSPRLVGRRLPERLLRTLYSGAAERLVNRWYDSHP